MQNIIEPKSQEVQPADENPVTLLNLSFNNIPTKMKGSVRKVSKIPRRDISVEKHTSVGFQESESEMGETIYSYLSPSKMINGRTLLAETKATKKHGRGKGVENSLAKRIRRPWR